MLSRNEHDHIFEHAYVPEHLVEYVTAVSGGKPYYFQGYVCYFHRNDLILIGYPLTDNPAALSRVYSAACERFKPHSVTLVTDDLSGLPAGTEIQPVDQYYRLNLPLQSVDPSVAYMVRRAAKELTIALGRFGREHQRIIKDFVDRVDFSAAQVRIFKQVSNYLKHSKSAHMLEARKTGRVVAFSIVDLGSAHYAFYQFNFRSQKVAVPGASDLLLNEMIRLAQENGKQAINLGLGVHSGIRRFKEKWGAKAFLGHRSVLIQRKPAPDISKLSKKL